MTSGSVVMLQFGTEVEVEAHEEVPSGADGMGNISLMHQFHRASQLADELFIEELKECKITPRQFVVLSAVEANAGASQTQIVTLTGIDRSTIADIIRRMVKLKLVSRKRTKDDARAYSVSATDYGQEILKTAREAAVKVDKALLARLTSAGAEELQKSLHSLSRDAVL